MARTLGVYPKTLRNWHNGARTPSESTIQRICVILGVDPQRLIATAEIEDLLVSKIPTFDELLRQLGQAHKAVQWQYTLMFFGYVVVHVLASFQERGFTAVVTLPSNAVECSLAFTNASPDKCPSGDGIMELCMLDGRCVFRMCYDEHEQTPWTQISSLTLGLAVNSVSKDGIKMLTVKSKI